MWFLYDRHRSNSQNSISSRFLLFLRLFLLSFFLCLGLFLLCFGILLLYHGFWFLLYHGHRSLLRLDGDGGTTPMVPAVSLEGIEKTSGILLCCCLGVHKGLLVAGRDKAALHQTPRHRRQTEHRQVILLGTHILTSCRLTDIPLHILGQFHRILHVLVLNELKHDITLRRVRVIALIGLLIVFLQEDHGVLTLSDLQVLQHTGLLSCPLTRSQSIGLEATRHLTLRQGVDMDGDEEVGLVLVGDLRPTVEFHEGIGLAGIDDLHVRTILLDHLSEGQGIPQRQVLFLHLTLTDGTRIKAAMSGIDHQCEGLIGSLRC